MRSIKEYLNEILDQRVGRYGGNIPKFVQDKINPGDIPGYDNVKKKWYILRKKNNNKKIYL